MGGGHVWVDGAQVSGLQNTSYLEQHPSMSRTCCNTSPSLSMGFTSGGQFSGIHLGMVTAISN